MKKRNFWGFIVLVVGVIVWLSSCSNRFFGSSSARFIPLVVSDQRVSDTYRDLDKSVKVIVKDNTSKESQMPEDSKGFFRLANMLSSFTHTPSVESFAREATESYMTHMNFDISPSADYTMRIDVKTFNPLYIDKKTIKCTVGLVYRLTDEAGASIVPTSTVEATITLNNDNPSELGTGLAQAYADALEKIRWDRIADCLRVAKTAKQEKNAQVNGDGDTALEHTVIRWYILSSPQGADVSWRVISSTPDVANTNSNYVGTTPYESTESFDIKGLTYNNSGNVQVEVTCEKVGFMSQRKRFNLRQAIDQKEISAKFNLVKDE